MFHVHYDVVSKKIVESRFCAFGRYKQFVGYLFWSKLSALIGIVLLARTFASFSLVEATTASSLTTIGTLLLCPTALIGFGYILLKHKQHGYRYIMGDDPFCLLVHEACAADTECDAYRLKILATGRPLVYAEGRAILLWKEGHNTRIHKRAILNKWGELNDKQPLFKEGEGNTIV